MSVAPPVFDQTYSATTTSLAYPTSLSSSYNEHPSLPASNQSAYRSMYSQHGGHHSFNSHGHHAGAYGNSASSGGGGHHGSTDSGLAPQSSFDTVPGSQHSGGGGMHSSANTATGNGQWGQSMHYSNSAGSAGQGGYGGGNPYGTSYYGASQASAGAQAGNAYGSYGIPPTSAANAGGYGAATGHNGALPNGGATSLNGTAANSAHHSGSSTPTSQTPYHHQHPHSLAAMPQGGGGGTPQGYGAPHHQQGGYYGASAGGHGSASSNSVMSSPSYTSAPQYSAQLPLAGRHRVTTTLWEDEGTLCFQVDARGVCVARRHDNNMINGTKLLNVCGMSRGKRDGILKNEKERIVVKVGAMHLKGVWITFQRGKQLAEQNNILDALYPLFETNIQSFLYHPDNYPRTAAVMAAAQERHAQRSRVSLGTDSPTNGYTRASSTSANSSLGQINPPPLMRSNTTPNTALGAAGYGHANGYSSAPNHSPSGHLGGAGPQSSHSLHAQSHALGGGGGGGNSNGVMPQRPSPVDRRVSIPFGEVNGFNGSGAAGGPEPYSNAGLLKQRTYSGFKRGLDDATNAADHGFVASSYDDRV